MRTHFPTVPVETALQKAPLHGPERVRPLVLVVDDEPILAETLAAILMESGLSAMQAYDPETALETAQLIPPDILIADLASSGMDGLELGLRVRHSVPDCDVILFSGHVSNLDTLSRLKTAGPEFTTLAKPVHPTDLLEQVFRCLRKRRFPALKQPVFGVRRPFQIAGEDGAMLQPYAGQEHIILKRRSRPARPAN